MEEATPAFAPRMVPSAMFTCPEIPTWPPNITLFPIFDEPAIPVCEAITESSPISTLCATCTKLSSLTPFLMMVLPNVARSIVVFEPISTSSSITTFPVCGIFLYVPSSDGANPKPSEPITALAWIIQLLPITHPS
ncbi:hypothetical protein SDC9_206720 [bioreactor metagenome]|uniref:Uncharacterized protein n=1 Tax=bioreactor metagenome TaxID=1076179 RepID=A0A645JHD4_9ZZZZ